jgi:hypothetical protein
VNDTGQTLKMKYLLKTSFIIILTLFVFSACKTGKNSDLERKKLAEQYFRSVYGGDTSGIDSLVSEDVVSSYPVFEQILGTKTISGRDALKDFALGFVERWKDEKIRIDEAVAEGESVVLVWTFSAMSTKTTPDSSLVAGHTYSWGGITLFHFDESGRITGEIGEESSPGPFERLKPGTVSK